QPRVEDDLPGTVDGEEIVGRSAVVDQRVPAAAAVHRQAPAAPEILIAEREQAVDLEAPGLIVGARGVHYGVITACADDREAAIVSLPVVTQELDAVDLDGCRR